ncbi:DNA polymerase Y family protein [uncultured Brevundimonas sp.]|uniref:Y-family DNA polymerase n=1 Tax=uncultured Brevundimonas sp. TaxID=213418 RepID=UPI0025CBC75B|nr:DNA polymerase Y family protein [uncultured Brevundimonas sp.]
MTPDPFANSRRYLALWFPWLPSDRLRRGTSAADVSPDPAPVVFVEKVGGALRLAAVDPSAARAGLAPGLMLADARARTPSLRTIAHKPDADMALLLKVMEDFGRFTPMIAEDPPHGLMLDVTGCTHLFGDEAGLVRAAGRRAVKIGLEARSALASTPHAARALSRFGPGGLYAVGEDRRAVRALPVAALELPDLDIQALKRAGLKQIADLDDRPRASLAARFGAEFVTGLARILGDEDMRITPYRPSPPISVDRIFFEPVTTDAHVRDVLSDLLSDAADRLDQTQQGGRAFEAGFYRVDGHVRHIVVRTGRATRDVGMVLRLFQERFAVLASPLDPGYGFDQIRLSVLETQTLKPVQPGLEGDRPDGQDLNHLIDRLKARLGPDAVLSFEPLGSHIPECAGRMVSATPGTARPAHGWPDLDPDDPPLRPLQMFDTPQPVETLAEVPDGSPLRFRWRRVLHEVALAEGPERIGGEWWRAPGQKTRDYYRVEDREGRRFWLFRQGLYGETDEPRWFVHGLFA